MDGELTLLRAWLDGSLSPEELPRFEAWLKADPEHLRRLVMASALEAQLDQLVSDRVGTDAALIERPAISDRLGEELVEAYLAGDLAAAELPRLQQWLQYDSLRLRRLMLDAAFEYDLHQQVSARVESDRYEPSTDQTPLRLPTGGAPLSDRRPRPGQLYAITSYAAAGVLLAAALLLWIAFPPPSDRRAPAPPAAPPLALPQTPQAPAPSAPEGRFQALALGAGACGVCGSASGGAAEGRFQALALGSGLAIERDSRKLPLHGETRLQSGDRLLVSPGGHGELRISDGSHVLLEPGSVLGWDGRERIELSLAYGQLRVAAAPQSIHPLRVLTASASATVLGTVFTLESDGERTLLQVHEGEVELAAGGERLAVQAGAEAVADRDGLHPLHRASNWLGAELPWPGAPSAELLPFVDLMRYARPWHAQWSEDVPEERRQPLQVDQRGWIASLAPGQRASTVILHGGSYPAGVYTCHYQGEGLIEFGYGANIIRSERGRLEVDVTPLPHGLMLHVVETDPENPIRDIRLVMPGFEASFRDEPFNPAFVEALRGIAVLRAHSWSEGHGEDWLSWQDRRRPGDGPGLRDARERVAVEDLLRLVRQLDCEFWLTAPYNADDGYLRELAALVHRGLPAGRRLYLEYSSEIWNGLFPRVKWCIRQGQEHGYQGKPAGIAFANDRSEALWNAFESATAGERELVRVLSFNDVDFFRSHQQGHGQAFARADALAIYGGIRGGIGQDLGAEGLARADREQLLQAARQRASAALEEIDGTLRLRQRYGKRVIAYGAGAMFWADSDTGVESWDPISQQAGAIAHDPALAPLLSAWLRSWRRQVGDLAVIPLEGDYGRILRPDTPSRERWARSPLGPSWWILHRHLEPIAPFPPPIPAAAQAPANEF